MADERVPTGELADALDWISKLFAEYPGDDPEQARVMTERVRELHASSARLRDLEAEVGRLRERLCQSGDCNCEVPDGWLVEYENGGLFPQTSGWYFSKESKPHHWRGGYSNRHAAVQSAITAAMKDTRDAEG